MKIGLPGLVIRKGDPRDAADLSRLAARLFRLAYEGQMPERDLELYIAEDFGLAQQRRELEDHRIATLLAEIDGEIVGYAQLRQKPVPVEGDFDIALELWRIYLERACQGAGIGRRLLAAVGKSARNLGAERIWLGVWEQNCAALAFYRRNGFEAIGSQPFEIGTELHTDIVMAAKTDAF